MPRAAGGNPPRATMIVGVLGQETNDGVGGNVTVRDDSIYGLILSPQDRRNPKERVKNNFPKLVV